MTTVRRTRRLDCPVDGDIELDEACCPVCTRPLEPCDGATQERWGYDNPTVMPRVVCICEHCPTDDLDQTPAFEVTWTDKLHREGWGVWVTARTETAKLIGVFTPDGELERNLDAVERELFRVCFPELAKEGAPRVLNLMDALKESLEQHKAKETQS